MAIFHPLWSGCYENMKAMKIYLKLNSLFYLLPAANWVLSYE